MDEAVVHKPIPCDLVKVLGVEPQIYSKAETFTQAFLKNNAHLNDTKSVLSHKAVILEYSRPKKKTSTKMKAKGMNAQQKREMKIFHVKSEHQRYELFLPLHELWKQYIIHLCNGLNPTSSPQSVQKKLVKADFHGAIIIVIPKRNSVFEVEINGFSSYIYGNKFEYRASERSAKKFKISGSIDL
ncbi:ribonuclease P protein subunit p29-like isoform X2 [Corythoichthys intestinalis]|uniref:ribonuclease P protein subunit p29-like isoform X2 n=1 Tax=Corythoichthys intestinalis TaxID=161448 RepID=UPI0025A544DA|nr:ribonuclease P protein subunit p29-like isoform X2 [Corythoichthys intestinalis]XP_057698465.1 ribonuclease P protein subunit p29-like isoform X2 [Corythoichthys intestinalis]